MQISIRNLQRIILFICLTYSSFEHCQCLVPVHFDFPLVVYGRVIKCFGMSGHVCVTGQSKTLVCPAVSV